MKSFEVRQGFINYFKKNHHQEVASSSLIPENDPTLLFANAGMNQFKNTFLGLEKRDYVRAVSSQKCLRAGGKHNDLENVGFTARHHTFFEMLGNFSFGDYFKKDAIHFAWEFLTRDLQISKDKLYVTVFEKDDEAAEIWYRQEGVPRERIFRFGEKDNFWRMGDTGPCGPCSEIFYDHGPEAGKESDPFKGIAAGEDRFVEIWNLVFMQFYEKAPGVMEPLPKPSVDTGSGLERVTAAMQGVFNNYQTDLFIPMIEKACNLLHWDLEELHVLEKIARKNPVDPRLKARPVLSEIAALRVMADHSRATAFLLADGALPSNEGRGYVLRRILRRAVHYGRKLSSKDSFLPLMIETLIQYMGEIYPELKARREHILSVIRDEESRFLTTLDSGTQILREELQKLSRKKITQIPGELVFKLYDTYGFPVDLTQVMASEHHFSVDESDFERRMHAAREKAKLSWKGKALDADEGHLVQWSQQNYKTHGMTFFKGYEVLETESQVLDLSNGKAPVKSLKAGERGLVILDVTPFYGEGGGQAGDEGLLVNSSVRAHVHNTTKQNEIFLHHVEVLEGELKWHERVKAQVSDVDRRNTAANHSATHLLHAALRKVLGTHVTQAGSLVDATKLRFDFTHPKALGEAETEAIEKLVNEEVARASDVIATLMPYQKAIESGAMALFGEKYGDEVRVLKMGDFSVELCGGTHVKNTSHIRMFKIISETGVSSGVRRIEALTADLALKYFLKNTQENQIARTASGIGENGMQYLTSVQCVADWIEKTKSEVKDLEREIKKLKGAQVSVDDLMKQAVAFEPQGFETSSLLMSRLEIDDREVLSSLADQLKDKLRSAVVILIGQGEGVHPTVVSVSKNLSSKFPAGQILKEVGHVMGGKGGGRPEFAQGSITQINAFDKGYAQAKALVGAL